VELARWRRLAEPRVARQLARVGLDSPLPFLAEFALDDAGVRSYAEDAPLNTDDNLYLEFWSPLAIGSRGAPFNVLSIDEHRVNPAVILRDGALFASEAEAAATLARHHDRPPRGSLRCARALRDCSPTRWPAPRLHEL
jgi:hypothetical protein